jgi:YegS/Rv2252/BmrU family lipid kinase
MAQPARTAVRAGFLTPDFTSRPDPWLALSPGVRACVIFNPAARGDKARRALAHLERLGPEAVLRPTRAAGDGHRLAREAAQEGFGAIVAVGGDGTLNEVLNGLAASPQGLAACPLAVLPLGTANVFAREIGMPMQAQEAWRVIQTAKSRTVDVIEMQFTHRGVENTRLFLQLAGAGLDARATETVDWNSKKRWGFLAYVVACLRALRETHAPIEVVTPAVQTCGELVLLGNGRLYGGPFPLFEGAQLSDGLMDVAVFPHVHPWLALACCWAASTGRWRQLKGVQRFRTAEIQLSARNRVPVELDGEPVGTLPARGRVRPMALQVLVP